MAGRGGWGGGRRDKEKPTSPPQIFLRGKKEKNRNSGGLS